KRCNVPRIPQFELGWASLPPTPSQTTLPLNREYPFFPSSHAQGYHPWKIPHVQAGGWPRERRGSGHVQAGGWPRTSGGLATYKRGAGHVQAGGGPRKSGGPATLEVGGGHR